MLFNVTYLYPPAPKCQQEQCSYVKLYDNIYKTCLFMQVFNTNKFICTISEFLKQKLRNYYYKFINVFVSYYYF